MTRILKKEPEKYYKKVNGRYKKVGYEFSGFPVNGIWMVKDGSQNCIMYMDDIGKKPIPFIDLKKHHNDIMEAVYKITLKPHNTNNIVNTVLEYIASQIEYEKLL